MPITAWVFPYSPAGVPAPVLRQFRFPMHQTTVTGGGGDMSLVDNISDLATRVAQEINAVRGEVDTLPTILVLAPGASVPPDTPPNTLIVETTE